MLLGYGGEKSPHPQIIAAQPNSWNEFMQGIFKFENHATTCKACLINIKYASDYSVYVLLMCFIYQLLLFKIKILSYVKLYIASKHCNDYDDCLHVSFSHF